MISKVSLTHSDLGHGNSLQPIRAHKTSHEPIRWLQFLSKEVNTWHLPFPWWGNLFIDCI